ncbi:MAG: tyrosine-protein phosphatase [Acidimicrobiales bacterium]|nr:tyrosine-protein phosphatase [Acidimicrobiales bacterium]
MAARPSVRREGADLVVSWDVREPIEIAISMSPDVAVPVDAEVRYMAPGEAIIRGLDAGCRHYVHLMRSGLRSRVLAERLVPLVGATNFRDLGGYAAGGGRTVRWGRVYRSDALSALTQSDLEYLRAMGVRVVIDHRAPHETEVAPCRARSPQFELVNHIIGDGSEDRRLITDRIRDGELREITVADMTAFYFLTFERHATEFGSVLRRVADPSQHALVFCCTAGKDRTGMTAALLLAALGVDEATILDDYELTNGYRSERRQLIIRELRNMNIDPEPFLPFFTAEREVLAGALRLLKDRYGNIRRYLAERAGVGPEVIDALRSSLLVER